MNQFKAKLNLACGKDEQRPILNHIYFSEGKAIATDGHILIAQDLDLNEFEDNISLDMFEGKYLHSEVFKEVFKYNILGVDEEGLLCIKENISCKFLWSKPFDKFPNWKNVIPEKRASLPNLFLHPFKLAALEKVMIDSDKGMKLTFSGETSGIIVETPIPSKQQIGLIMPIMAFS